MRTRFLILAFLIFGFYQLFAQGNHIGTWKLVSAQYKSSTGETDSFNNSTVKETKIITPTHFMWMSQIPDSVDKSKMVLSGAGGGPYTINGNNYVETLEYASWEGYASDKTNFTLNIDGDIMTQVGEIKYPDGHTLTLEETWRREKLPPQDGEHVGVWHMTAQKVTDPKGKKTKTDMTKLKQVKILTPTHWMFISESIDNGKKKFRGANGGSYSLRGTKYVEQLENNEDIQTDYTLQIKGNKLYMVGSLLTPEGQKYIYDEVYQKEEDIAKKLAKSAK